MQIIRSEYSFLESTLKVSDIADFYANLGLKNGLLVDKNVTHGLLEFIFSCRKVGVNPIVGLEINLGQDTDQHILIAKNDFGYQTLLKISTFLSINDEKDYNFEEIYNLINDDVFHYTINSTFIKAGIIIDSLDIIDHMEASDQIVVKTLKQVGHHPFRNSTALFDLVSDFSEFGNIKYDLSYDKFLLPSYYPDEEARLRLRATSFAGAKKRYGINFSKQIQDRLDYELEIINKMGFDNYFMIMFDIVVYCAKKDILVGPGRGSAPSSLVAYSLGITGIDPIEHDLIFERFLNPERKSMPDIDLDIEDTRRDELIKYIIEKYGQERVANIITFTRYGIKMAVRDVARVFNYKEKHLETLLGKMGKWGEITKEGESYAASNEQLNMIYKISKKMVGLPKTTSIHAAGLIISPIPLNELTGLSKDNETIVTAYEHGIVEKIGLVKFDLLSLKNLTILQDIKHLIEEQKNIKVDFNKIPFDSQKTYSYFSAAATNGIFQFENEHLRKFMKRYLPDSLNDLSSLTALYRPGPMQEIDHFIERKHGRVPITYIFDELKPILENTYGVIVFQEQIMQVLTTIAGYTFAESDVVRRAISKKDHALIDEQENLFISKGISKGFDEQRLKQLWTLIIRFANYGFNKSHAVSYATIAYWLMYFKANYPAYFFSAYLNSFGTQKEKLSSIVTEARILGIDVEKPSIKNAKIGFFTDGKTIYSGLLPIEQIGWKTANEIELNSKNIVDVWEFLRLSGKIIDERIWVNLAKVGALDGLQLTRKELIENSKRYLSYDPLYPKPILSDKIEEEYSAVELQLMEYHNYGTTFTKFHGEPGQFLILQAKQFKTGRYIITKLDTLSYWGYIECVSFEANIDMTIFKQGSFVQLNGHINLAKAQPEFIFNRAMSLK